MGSISRVVAVLLIHIEISAVARRKPKTIWRGWLPMRLMMCSEIRRCRPCPSIANAMMNPPRYRNTFESAYARQTFFAPAIPSSG